MLLVFTAFFFVPMTNKICLFAAAKKERPILTIENEVERLKRTRIRVYTKDQKIEVTETPAYFYIDELDQQEKYQVDIRHSSVSSIALLTLVNVEGTQTRDEMKFTIIDFSKDAYIRLDEK